METPHGFVANFKRMQKIVHNNACEHGWWNETRSIGELLMLIVSEVAEAMEEERIGKPRSYFREIETGEEFNFLPQEEREKIDKYKPEGLGPELADVVIRCMDLAESCNINLGQAILDKHYYNKTRPYKHGGKLF